MPATTPRTRTRGLRVPRTLRARAEELIATTDAFCAAHLDEEYAELCRSLVGKLARRNDTPIGRGELPSWAGAVVHAIGTVNFLFDPTQSPHLRVPQISEFMDLSKATVANKSRSIRKPLDLYPMHPDFSRREVADTNPLTWMVEVNGLVVDARMLPLTLQRRAHELGLIPFFPPPPLRAPADEATQDTLATAEPEEAPAASGHLDLEVSLVGIEPRIWRRFLIRPTATFWELHSAIQDAFGWDDAHAWEFRGSDARRRTLAGTVQGDLWGTPPGPSDEDLSLGDYFHPGGAAKSCSYVYDMGDNWEHKVRLLGQNAADEPFERRLLDGARACPPEDCGGIPGYRFAVEIAGSPEAARRAVESGHEHEHVEFLRTWEPDAFDLDERKRRFDR